MFNKNKSFDQDKKDRTRRNCIAIDVADSSEIFIKNSTKQRLEKFGQMNETIDSLINKMLDHINTCDRWWENKYD